MNFFIWIIIKNYRYDIKRKKKEKRKKKKEKRKKSRIWKKIKETKAFLFQRNNSRDILACVREKKANKGAHGKDLIKTTHMNCIYHENYMLQQNWTRHRPVYNSNFTPHDMKTSFPKKLLLKFMQGKIGVSGEGWSFTLQTNKSLLPKVLHSDTGR
jgi:hypothetical protein